MEANADLLFRRWGEIYGPLRAPLDLPETSAYRQVFFLRDPRNVAVSAYHTSAL